MNLRVFDLKPGVMRNWMDQFFDTDLAPFYRGYGWTPLDASESAFSLPVATGWTDDAMNLRVIMPGVTAKDFRLLLHGDRLVIRGERKAPADFASNGSADYRLRYGKFERFIDLPDQLDLDKLKAKLHDGVLDIHIPFAPEARERTIPVTVQGREKAIAAAA